jgi:hypothetical protein
MPRKVELASIALRSWPDGACLGAWLVRDSAISTTYEPVVATRVATWGCKMTVAAQPDANWPQQAAASPDLSLPCATQSQVPS